MTDTERPTIIDEATFTTIWAEHAGRIGAYLHPRVGDAEDLCQDVFLKAWRIRDQYNPDRGTVLAWLYTIAGSLVADHYRATGRRPHTVAEADETLPDTAMTDVAEQATNRSMVTAALAALPEAQRQVIAHRFLADRSVQETAEALSMPAGTVKSTCARALAVLRTALGVVVPVTARKPPPPALADVAPPESEPARSLTVAHRPAHRRPHRGDRPHHAGRRHARPARPGQPPGVPGPRHPRLADPSRPSPAAPPVRAVPAGPDPLRRRIRPQHRPHGAVPARHLRLPQEGGLPLMFAQPFAHQPTPGWVAWALGVLLFSAGIAWFVATLLRSISLRPFDWGWWPRHGRAFAAVWARRFGRHGRHRRPYLRADRSAVVFDTGRAPTVFAPEPTVPGPDSPLTTVEMGEPEPDSDESDDAAALAEMARQFRSGFTMTDPRFARILREAYAKAGVR